jgi:RimJ/RimL family protein N-acetyltransferase
VPAGVVLETERLVLRRLTDGDAEFILELLNGEAFLRYIGDKGVRTGEDAVRYIREGPMASYERHGFGLYRVELKEGGEAVGICGLLQRDALPDPDVGFALLPRYWSRGYAREAAAAVLAHARTGGQVRRVLAITSPDNTASMAVLAALGFRFDRVALLPGSEAEVRLFISEAGPDTAPAQESTP